MKNEVSGEDSGSFPEGSRKLPEASRKVPEVSRKVLKSPGRFGRFNFQLFQFNFNFLQNFRRTNGNGSLGYPLRKAKDEREENETKKKGAI